MGIKERRDKEKIELKNKIIIVAEELFAEAGYQNISMRKIANEIEYSLPTIYRFFENKSDILFYIYNENNGRLLSILMEISKNEYNIIEKLKDMSRAYIHFALQNPHYYELAYMSNALRYEKDLAYNDPETPGFKVYNLMLLVIMEAKEQGYFQNKDVEVIGQCLWAGIHGLTSLFIGHDEFPWKDNDLLIENMLSILMS